MKQNRICQDSITKHLYTVNILPGTKNFPKDADEKAGSFF